MHRMHPPAIYYTGYGPRRRTRRAISCIGVVARRRRRRGRGARRPAAAVAPPETDHCRATSPPWPPLTRWHSAPPRRIQPALPLRCPRAVPAPAPPPVRPGGRPARAAAPQAVSAVYSAADTVHGRRTPHRTSAPPSPAPSSSTGPGLLRCVYLCTNYTSLGARRSPEVQR